MKNVTIDKFAPAGEKYLAKIPASSKLRIDGDQKLEEMAGAHLQGKIRAIVFSNIDIERHHKAVDRVIETYSTCEVIVFGLCKLKDIPNSTFTCKKLKILEIFDSSLATIDPKIGELQDLEYLSIIRSNIVEFPSAILACQRLNHLDLSLNRISSLPSDISKLKMLQVLRLISNQLVGLPDSICQLKALKHLIVNVNKIANIPFRIGELKNLVELDVADNLLNFVPEGLAEIPSLDEIYLTNNPISNLPLEFMGYGFVASASNLRLFFRTGRILNASSLGEFDFLQARRIARSSKALLIRGAFLAMIGEYKEGTEILLGAADLALRFGAYDIFVVSMEFITHYENKKDVHIEIELGLDFVDLWYSLKEQLENFEDFEDLQSLRLQSHDWIELAEMVSTPLRIEMQKRPIPSYSIEDFEQVTDIPMGFDFGCFCNYILEGELDWLAIDEEDQATNRIIATEPSAILEMNFRDLVRGLVWIDRWKQAVYELSINHQRNENSAGFRTPILCPAPSRDGEAGLRIVQLTNNDRVGIVIHFWNQSPQWFWIETTAISFNILAAHADDRIVLGKELIPKGLNASYKEAIEGGKFLTREKANYDFRQKSFFESFDFHISLWNATFGAKILKGIGDKNCESYLGMTLHQMLQQNNVTSLLITSMASFHGFSLGRAFFPETSQFAVELYSITNLPMWVHDTNNCTATIDELSICSNEYAKLPFASFETRFRNRHAMEQGKVFVQANDATGDPVLEDHIYELISKSRIIHFACHGNNDLQLSLGEETIILSTRKISELNIAAEIVFLNCCNTSKHDPRTITEDYTPSISFLAAGAKYVVAANTELEDYSAFRFSTRMYEKIAAHPATEIDQIFREVCLEAIQLKIPDYLDLIKSEKDNLLYAMALSRRHTPVDWEPYTLWKSIR